jgi:hypothetical protein
MTYFYLLAAHALCDFPLQGDYLAKGKNHRAPLPGTPWGICLAAHALIHGGAVALITGSLWLGIAETVAHAGIDFIKCEGWIDYTLDQILHLVCKGVWMAFLGANP